MRAFPSSVRVSDDKMIEPGLAPTQKLAGVTLTVVILYTVGRANVIKCRCGRSTSPRSSLTVSLVKRKVKKGSGSGLDAWSVRRRPVTNSTCYTKGEAYTFLRVRIAPKSHKLESTTLRCTIFCVES